MKFTKKEKQNMIEMVLGKIAKTPKGEKKQIEELEDIILKLDVNAFYRYMGIV